MDVCLRQCGVAWGIPARFTAAPNTFDTLWIRVPIYLGFVWAKTQGVSGQFLSHTRLSLNSGLCMKVWHLPTGSTPRDTYQRKIRLEPLKEDYGLESLLLRGIGVRVKD